MQLFSICIHACILLIFIIDLWRFFFLFEVDKASAQQSVTDLIIALLSLPTQI